MSVDKWVLAGLYAKGPCEGKPQFHRCDSIIGPMSTPKLEEAEVFDSKEAAGRSIGFTHWSSFLKPMTWAEANLFVSLHEDVQS